MAYQTNKDLLINMFLESNVDFEDNYTFQSKSPDKVKSELKVKKFGSNRAAVLRFNDQGKLIEVTVEGK